jgi:hypothetical protein
MFFFFSFLLGTKQKFVNVCKITPNTLNLTENALIPIQNH